MHDRSPHWRELDDPADRLTRALHQGAGISYWADHDPELAALLGPATVTYGELDGRVNRLARALRGLGVGPGAGVALLCRNRPEFVETWAACLRIGARLTPINTHLTADEVAYILGDCEAVLFVADAGVGDVAAGALASVATGPGPVGVWIGDPGEPPPAGFVDYESVLAAEDPSVLDDPRPGNWMLYTSGTTGRPKGVRRDGPAPAAVNTAGYRPGDRHLLTGPLYHAAPLMISLHATLGHGAALVVMDRWDAHAALRLIDEHRVTHTHMVPTMFHRLLALPEEVRAAHDPSSLRLVVHGAAPCPVHVKHAMIEWWGPVLVEYYAATEGAGSLVDSHQWLERPGTVGRPPEGHVVIVDDDGAEAPPGTAGRIYLRTAAGQEPFRYHGDEDKTARSYRGEHFTLGDVGYLDEDGWLYLTDRSAHVIISGGVNIYPAEVDDVLLRHPGVGDAATIGIPDDEWGETVLAVVEPAAGVAPDDDLAMDLIAFCRVHLAAYKCPRRIEFVDELPRGEAGKVPKARLREAYRR